jgi:hypothetical protein
MALDVPLVLKHATTVKCPTCGARVTIASGFWGKRTVDDETTEGHSSGAT